MCLIDTNIFLEDFNRVRGKLKVTFVEHIA